jgi:hypothetical protein
MRFVNSACKALKRETDYLLQVTSYKRSLQLSKENIEHLKPVLRIRIHGIHMFLGLPDPDPLVRGMDPDPDPALDPEPDPSIIVQKL